MSYALTHFGLAAGLALLAVAVGRKGRRNELAHVLWIVVLAKLLVPPFLEVPVLEPAPPAAIVASAGDLGASAGPPWPDLAPLDLARPAPERIPPASNLGPRQLLLGLWAGGALLLAVLYALSFARLRRMLAGARAPSKALQTEVRAAADELGLARPPRVRLVDRRVSPALWPTRPATLVIPTGLLEDLERDERRHLLLHELAHFQRKDHWVRCLEALVLVLYWWLPPVYWVRRKLRFTEEACCDARVIAAGGDGSTYASALIRTVEFLQGGSSAVPSLATGALAGNALARRITLMMNARPERRGRALWHVLLAGSLACLLPLLPTRAHAAPSSSPEPAAWTHPAPTASVPRPAPLVEDSEPELTKAERAAMDELFQLLAAHEIGMAMDRLDELRGAQGNAVFDFTAGNLAFHAGDYAAALGAYGVAVKKHPNFQRAWQEIGVASYRLGRHAEAASALRRSIELGGAGGVSYGLLGLSLQEIGDLAGAESALWMALTLDPEGAEWRTALIALLLDQSRYADALALIEQRAAQGAEASALSRARIQALTALGRTEDARAAIAAYIEAEGAKPQGTRDLGLEARLLAEDGDLALRAGLDEEAARSFGLALDRDAGVAAPRALRGAEVMAARGAAYQAQLLFDLIDAFGARELGDDAALWRDPLHPRALGERSAPAPGGSIRLVITDRGEVFFGDRSIGLEGVRALLEQLLSEQAREVTLQGEPGAPSAQLIRVLDEVRAAGAVVVGIATAREPNAPRADPDERRDEGLLRQLIEEGAPRFLDQARRQPGGVSTAMRNYENALSLGIAEAEARLHLAQALVAQKRYADAISHLRRAQELQPDESLADYIRSIEELEARVPAPPPTESREQPEPKEEPEPLEQPEPKEEPEPRERIAPTTVEQQPRVIKRLAPTVSAELRKKTPATVHVLFIVDEEGEVTAAKVDKSTDKAFERAAILAVQSWEFEPGTRDGKPVPFRMRVPVTFPKE